MAIANIFILFVATASMCLADFSLPNLGLPDFSKMSPGQLCTGHWTGHAYIPINKSDVFKCMKAYNDFVNVNTIRVRLEYVKNGEHIVLVVIESLDLMNLFHGKTFSVKDYRYGDPKRTIFCTHKINISLQRNVFIETECQDYGISKWCFSLTKDVSQEIFELCSPSAGYLITDNSNC